MHIIAKITEDQKERQPYKLLGGKEWEYRSCTKDGEWQQNL